MFTKEQIDFMIREDFGIDFSKPLTEDDYDQIEDKAVEIIQHGGFDKNYEPTPLGTMAESIIDAIPDAAPSKQLRCYFYTQILEEETWS